MTRLRLVAFIASLAGIAISIYLTALHFAGLPPACPTNQTVNCEAVLGSPYGVIAGSAIPTSAAGIVWFAVSAVLWTRAPGRIQLAWSGIGMLAVLFLVYVEIVRLGAVCMWCTAAHALVLVTFLVAVSRRARSEGAY